MVVALKVLLIWTVLSILFALVLNLAFILRDAYWKHRLEKLVASR